MASKNRFKAFSQAEMDVIDEALCAFTDEVIEDDELLLEVAKPKKIKKIRDKLIDEVQKVC